MTSQIRIGNLLHGASSCGHASNLSNHAAIGQGNIVTCGYSNSVIGSSASCLKLTIALLHIIYRIDNDILAHNIATTLANIILGSHGYSIGRCNIAFILQILIGIDGNIFTCFDVGIVINTESGCSASIIVGRDGYIASCLHNTLAHVIAIFSCIGYSIVGLKNIIAISRGYLSQIPQGILCI